MSRKENLTWLEKNRQLRMDANEDYISKSRRDFHKARYQFAAQLIEGGHVLDGACGTGYGSSILSHKATHVVGIDIEDDAVAYANEVYSSKNVTFQQSAVELTPYENNSFDAVISFETVEHTLCPDSHFKEIVRILKPDGQAIVSCPNGWGLTDHHFFDFDFDLLNRYTNKYFSTVSFYTDDPSKDYENDLGIHSLAKSTKKSECLIAVCKNPIKTDIPDIDDRIGNILLEIYKNSFNRHTDYLKIRRKLFHVGIRLKIKTLTQKITRLLNKF